VWSVGWTPLSRASRAAADMSGGRASVQNGEGEVRSQDRRPQPTPGRNTPDRIKPPLAALRQGGAMDASFSFKVDPSRDLVRIVMSGLFLPDNVARFLAARREAHALLACGPGRHLTLNDVRAMKIQPQVTVDAFHMVLADPAYRSRRLAFVASPTLARSQLMRALAGRDSRCFADPAAAEAWLLTEEDPGVDGQGIGVIGSRRWADAGGPGA
jgi:hypothetical protein